MKLSLILLTLALSAVVLGGIVPLSTINPNDIFRQVKFHPLNTLSYAGNNIIIKNPKLMLRSLNSPSATMLSHTSGSKHFTPLSASFQFTDADTRLLVSSGSIPSPSRSTEKDTTPKLQLKPTKLRLPPLRTLPIKRRDSSESALIGPFAILESPLL